MAIKSNLSANPRMSVRAPRMCEQKGLTLIEVSIAIAIAGMAAGWGLWALAQNMESEKARMQGSQLAVLGAALSEYSKQNFVALANGTAIAGFSVPAQPTIAELRTAGFLDPTFSTTSVYQTGYTLRATRSSACSLGATTPSCSITSIAALSAPMTYRGQTAWSSLGEAVNKLGAQGGYSSQATPAVISGVNATWTNANPVAGAGILAYRDVYGQSDNSTFLRRDGVFPMVGNLQMGGNDIRGGGGRLLTEGGGINTAGGSIAAGSGAISGGAISGSSVTATGSISGASLSATGSITGGAISGSSVTATGNVTGGSLRGTTVIATGNVSAGSVSSSGSVTAGSIVSSGSISGGAISGSSVTTAGTVSAGTVSATNVTATNVTANGTLNGRALTVSNAGNITLSGGGISGMRVASVGGGCSPSGSLSVSGSGEVLSCQAGQWRRQSTNADGGVIIERIVPQGGGCSPAGALGRNSSGELLACQSGTWQLIGSTSGPRVAVLSPTTAPSGTVLFAVCHYQAYGAEILHREAYMATWNTLSRRWHVGVSSICTTNVLVVYV